MPCVRGPKPAAGASKACALADPQSRINQKKKQFHTARKKKQSHPARKKKQSHNANAIESQRDLQACVYCSNRQPHRTGNATSNF